MRGCVVVVGLLAALSTVSSVPARAVSAYESAFNDPKHQYIMVQLDAEELESVKRSVYEARRIAAQGATEMLQVVGIPESVTGKASALVVWPVLCDRLAADFRRQAREVPSGQNVTLRYKVNVSGLRALWEASGQADDLMPGSEATKAVVGVINRLVNAALR